MTDQPDDLEALTASGDAVRRSVLGDAYVDASAEQPFTEPFREYVTRSAWAQVWARDGLDRRTRSCVTLAVLAALGWEHELALHVEVAVRNGLSVREIQEVLLHTSVYAGAPSGNTAFAVARGKLRELGVIDG